MCRFKVLYLLTRQTNGGMEGEDGKTATPVGRRGRGARTSAGDRGAERCADRGVADGVQRRASAQQLGLPDAKGVRGTGTGRELRKRRRLK